MQITAIFNDIGELIAFANAVSGSKAGAPSTSTPAPAAQQTPTLVARQVAPTPAPAPASAAQPTPASAPVVQPTPVPAPAPVPTAQQEPTQTVPVGSHDYSLDEISVAAMSLMDAGRQADLQQLLMSFGVPSLPALPRERYGAFATQLRALGARI